MRGAVDVDVIPATSASGPRITPAYGFVSGDTVAFGIGVNWFSLAVSALG